MLKRRFVRVLVNLICVLSFSNQAFAQSPMIGPMMGPAAAEGDSANNANNNGGGNNNNGNGAGNQDKNSRNRFMGGDRPRLRDPFRNGGNNQDRSENSGSDSNMGINALRFEGIDESKVNGVVCSLVDGLANDDLMFAAQNLASKMEKVDGCQGPDSPTDLKASLSSLAESGKKLNFMSKENEDLAKTPEALKTYEAEVTNAISSLDSIGKSLSSSPFLNSKCGRNLISNTDALLSVSKMIQSVAPYALKAVQAHPAFAVGARFIMGINGAATFITALKKMHDENTLDMNNEANQRAVRQNICEYGRIDYRIKSFILAKDGDLNKVTEQISSKYNSYRIFLANKYLKNNGMSGFYSIKTEKFDIINEIQKDLRKHLKNAKDNKKELTALASQINSGKNMSLSCNTALELVSRASLSTELPAKVMETLKNVTNNQDSVTISQKSLIKTEVDLRTEIIKSFNNITRSQINTCVELGKDYIDTLIQVSDLTMDTIKDLRQQADDLDSDILDVTMVDPSATMETALEAPPEKSTIIDSDVSHVGPRAETAGNGRAARSNNPFMRSFSADTGASVNPVDDATKTKKGYKDAVQAIKQEMDRLIAIVDSSQEPNVLKTLGADNSAIGMTAIGKFMDDSKMALFDNGKKGWSCKSAEMAANWFDFRPNLCPESPTLAFLTYSQKQMATKQANFDRALNELRMDISKIMTATGKRPVGRPITDQEVLKDLETAKNLSPINLTTIPKQIEKVVNGEKQMVKNPYHENICRRLIDIRQEWYFTLAAYAQQQQVCAYIYNLQDDGFEPRLRQYCGYRKDLPGKDERVSTLRKNYDQLQKVSGKDAALIMQKSKDLGCSDYYGALQAGTAIEN